MSKKKIDGLSFAQGPSKIKNQIFEFNSHLEYLKHKLSFQSPRSGVKSKIAKWIGCDSGYLSRILQDKSFLSLEQGERLNSFFGHDSTEADYFLLLIQRDRAGTPELRRYFEEKRKAILESRKLIANRVSSASIADPFLQSRYYSSWKYIAVHMAQMIDGMKNTGELAKRLQISEVEVMQILDFLKSNGIDNLGKHVHLDKDSPFLKLHHSNWRLKSLENMGSANSENLHYSVVYSLSETDVEELRESLLNLIRKNKEQIKDSADEALMAFNCDLFRLI